LQTSCLVLCRRMSPGPKPGFFVTSA
jgi:hypothetical protein